jgi:lipopolysaccharide transport system permease protein
MANIFLIFTKYRDVFWQLTTKELRIRYKQSVLGFAWAIFVPLFNLLVLSIVFSYFFRVPTQGIPYPVFLFVALVPWTFMVNSITSATGSISSNSSLITKVYLPREIFPLASIAAKLIDLGLTSLVLFGFLLYYGVSQHYTLLFIPIILVVQLLFLVGVSFILSATNVFFRDVENILGVFLTGWLYLSPVIYSSELVPEHLQFWYYLNPMVGIINGYRNVILYGVIPDGWFYYSSVVAVVTFLIGVLYFKERSKYFADVV